jgi:predicted lipase
LQESEEVEPEDLDDMGSFKYPFISVTDLIHSLRGRKTEYAFPIFRSDEYWNKKFDLYKNGIFDSYELQFIEKLLKKDASGNYLPVDNQEALNKIRDRIEGKLSNGVRKGGLWK